MASILRDIVLLSDGEKTGWDGEKRLFLATENTTIIEHTEVNIEEALGFGVIPALRNAQLGEYGCGDQNNRIAS